MRKLLLAISIITLSIACIAQDTVSLKASYYHSRYNGRKTTSGERYNEKLATAASNDYPIGTKLLIINKSTGKSVVVTVNDRMAAYIKNRIDLSKYAFKELAPIAQGIQKIRAVEIL